MDTIHEIRPVSASSLRMYIARDLRDLILKGIFKPGERLVESEIAEKMGVSRPPLREALSALEQEGLVVNYPRRGNFVIDFSDQDIEEIYSFRLLLEVGALNRMVVRQTREDLDFLQQLLDQLGEVVWQSGMDEQRTTLDLAFHEHICICAGHSRLLSAWRSMGQQTRILIGMTSQTYYQSPKQPMVLHQSILDAIIKRDLAEAEERLRLHFVDAENRAHAAMQRLHSES
jgi:DNA-binding GntR family transcriptional regulator